MNKETFGKGMAILREAFNKMEFNTRLYWEMLKDLQDHDFEAAVMKLVRSLKEAYPGTNLIALIRHEIVSKKYPSVGEAWEDANTAVQGFGIPCFSHPLIKRAAQMIGIHELRTTDNPGATRAHFIKFYEDLIREKREAEIEKVAAFPEPQSINLIEANQMAM